MGISINAEVRAEQHILAEQVRLIYKMLPYALLASLVAVMILAIALWDTAPRTTLLAWLIAIISIGLLRIVLYLRYISLSPPPESARAWAIAFTIGGGFMGAAWGSLSLFLYPSGSLPQQMLIIFMLSGMITGAMSTLSPLKGAYLVFLLFSMLPLAVQTVAQDTPLHFSMSVMLVVFIATLLGTYRQIHGSIVDNFKTRFHNTELLKNMSLMQQLEAVNLTLQDEIVERKSAEEHARTLAHYDPLTGLPNRLLMRERLGRAILHAQRTHNRLAVLFIDLDHFKNINDSLGHTVGDDFLKTVGACLLESIRENDTVSRTGGDEFVIILPDIHDPQDTLHVTHNIMQALNKPVILNRETFHISASIGISIYPEDGVDVETLIKHADTAMYAAKDLGRGQHQFFIPAMNARAREQLALENQLHRALEQNELTLQYQPQINLDSGTICAVEALVSWQHPERGLLTKDYFSAIAEQTSFITPVSIWALRQACRQARLWIDSGHQSLALAIVMPLAHFKQPDFIVTITDILRETQLPPEYLELELSENTLLHTSPHIDKALRDLHDLGVRLTIDNFGSGYFHLDSLARLPVSQLKIDQSLIKDVRPQKFSQAAIITAIISMGNVSVIVGGVETEAHIEWLKAVGCRKAQGPYFHPPMTGDDLGRLLGTASGPL